MSVEGNYKCSLVYEIKEKGLRLSHYGIMKLYQDQGQLKGSMFPTFFWLNSPFRCGKVDGKEFSFTVHFATPCQQFSMDVKGVVDGENITGKATNSMGVYILEGVRVPDR